MEEKIKKFKSMTNEQLENIIYNPESSEEDVIIASIEKGHKDIKEGKYYTTEEISEYFNNLATSC
jgi:predicted transcriptional regulator